MSNLFSMFDPSISFLNFNWLAPSLFLLIFPSTYWLFPSRISIIYYMFTMTLVKELSNNFQSKKLPNFIIFISLFLFLFFNNFLGLCPYIFTAPSHLIFSISFSLPNWLSFFFYGWMKFYNTMFLHLVPKGTPLLLSSFMVLIETISSLIRPLTLSIRLTANMIAGHLLLCLLSSLSKELSFLFILNSPFLSILLSLEYAVSFIQSYVFTSLLSLYFNEI